MKIFLTICSIFVCFMPSNLFTLPTVEPGLFVISGVQTCGNNTGYCLLGSDCTMNEDFQPDNTGHCDGLKTAFTPKAYFICCRYIASNKTFDQLIEAESATVLLPLNETTNNERENEIERDVSSTTMKIATSEDIPVKQKNNEFVDLNPDKIIQKLSAANHLDCETSEEQISSKGLHFNAINDLFGVDFEKIEKSLQTFQPAQQFKDTPKTTHKICAKNIEITGRSLKPESTKNAKQFEINVNYKIDNEECITVAGNKTNTKCANIWKFQAKEKIICYGILVNPVWILTSASCVLKIHISGFDLTRVTDLEEKFNDNFGISNLIVHENYKMEGRLDFYNIGLVSLDRLTNTTCFSCLPKQDDSYVEGSCTLFSGHSLNSVNNDSVQKCENRLKISSMYSKTFLSLFCASNEQFKDEMNATEGNVVWCNGIAVGLQTSYEKGTFTFTPLSDYSDWISQNIQLYA